MTKINDINKKEINKPEEQNVTLEILKRLKDLEEENKRIKESQKNIYKSSKEKYTGPRAYSYKMWGGIPVLNYESFRKDNTKDLTYKNEYGNYMSNHYLKLSLANGEKVDVEVTEFNKNFTRSEKEECEVLGVTDNPIGFKFKNDEFGEFIVDIKIIN